MEKATEQILARRIVRAVAASLVECDFRLTKPTFACRAGDHVTFFLHFHKSSFGPVFRIHLGVRVMNDPFDAIALNGPAEEHAGRFSDAESAVQECIGRMSTYCRETGVSWVDRWADVQRLLESSKSPLAPAERDALRADMTGQRVPARVAVSERLLGLRRSTA